MRDRPKILVAGGGVAALETLLALHELAGRHMRVELLAPGTHFLYRRVPIPSMLCAARLTSLVRCIFENASRQLECPEPGFQAENR